MRKREHKYINGTRGVISLFLAILMLPFTIFVGALVNANRVNSAVAVFDEALCNSANSTLGTYEPFLKKRFGLLCLKADIKGAPSEADVQEFINDTFSDYMKINCGALSNTFFDTSYDACGVYPLSDPDVMKGQILQFSKYAVPKQLIEDKIDISKLVKSFESLIPGYAFFDSLKNLLSGADTCLSYSEDLNLLKTRTATQDGNYQTYQTAYNEFSAAVTAYHSAKKALEDAQTAAESADEEGASAASEALTAAQSAFDNAKSALSTKKNAYSASIKTLHSSIEKVAEQQKELNEDVNKLGKNAVDSVSSFGEAFLEQSKLNNEKALNNNVQNLADLHKNFEDGKIDKATYEEQKKALEDENKRLTDSILQAKAEKQGISIGIDQWDSAYKKLSNAEKVENVAHYQALLSRLDSLHTTVSAYDCDTAPTITKEAYFVDLGGLLLTEEDITAFENSLVAKISSDGLVTYFMATVNFLKALINLGLTHNRSLEAEIDTGFYNSTYGGLPSQKDRARYPLTNANTAADRAKSAHINDILNGYGSASTTPGSAAPSLADTAERFSELLLEFIRLPSPFGGTLAGIVVGLIKYRNLIVEMVQCFVALVKAISEGQLVSMIYQKTLIAGYFTYVTPCRTTFQEGTELTKTSSNEVLPGDSLIDDEGLCFRGAEREYLAFGKMKEADNQSKAFWIIYVLRLITNVVPIVTNSEVDTTFSTILTVPVVGVLLSFVYIVALTLVESLIDTCLMVWGQKIPLIKKTVYLTLGGIANLYKDAKGLIPTDILDSYKKETKKAEDASPAAPPASNSSDKADQDSDKTDQDSGKTDKGSGKKENNSSGFLYVSYEDFLFLNLCLVPTDRLLKRFADLVEMEANWNARQEFSALPSGETLPSGGTTAGGSSGGGFDSSDQAEATSRQPMLPSGETLPSGGTTAGGSSGGGFDSANPAEATSDSLDSSEEDKSPLGKSVLFDLDYAYTYVRAAGSFRMSEFIPSPQIPEFTSKERVIYRGY